MEIFSSQHEDNSDLKVDISDDVSLDPLVLIANLNKRFKDIGWVYNNKTNRVSINTRKNAFVLQIPIPLANLFGLQESDVDYVNSMTTNHKFLDTWYYKIFWTEKFMNVMKTQNNLSIYELLGHHGFPTRIFFTSHYLATMNFMLNDQ